MRLSKDTTQALYEAIHSEIIDVRVRLKLPPAQDVVLAQVVHEIWARQKKVLKLPEQL